MTTPEQLDRLIDDHLKGDRTMPQTPEEKLTVSLIDFAGSFQLDADFDAALSVKLRQTTPSTDLVSPRQKRISTKRALRVFALSAAALVLMSIAILTVPPLRTLAQEMFNFFVVGTMTPPPTHRPVVRDTTVTITEDIEEAEAIAGFEAVEVHDPRFTLDGIQTGEGFINIYYDASEESGFTNLTLSQWTEIAAPMPYPVPPEEAIQRVMVNGVQGEYASGVWGYNDTDDGREWGWLPDVLGILVWRQGEVSFILSSFPADTPETLIAIAEALR